MRLRGSQRERGKGRREQFRKVGSRGVKEENGRMIDMMGWKGVN